MTRVDELCHRIALEVLRDAHVGLPVLDGDSLHLHAGGQCGHEPELLLGGGRPGEQLRRAPSAATACVFGTSRATGCTLSFEQEVDAELRRLGLGRRRRRDRRVGVERRRRLGRRRRAVAAAGSEAQRESDEGECGDDAAGHRHHSVRRGRELGCLERACGARPARVRDEGRGGRRQAAARAARRRTRSTRRSTRSTGSSSRAARTSTRSCTTPSRTRRRTTSAPSETAPRSRSSPRPSSATCRCWPSAAARRC